MWQSNSYVSSLELIIPGPSPVFTDITRNIGVSEVDLFLSGRTAVLPGVQNTNKKYLQNR